MKRSAPIILTTILFLLMLSSGIMKAEPSINAGTAESVLKLAGFEESFRNESKDVTIYVMGAPQIAEEFRKLKGHKIGKATLKRIVEGKELPEEKPDIYFIGDPTNLFPAIMYTRAENVLSITNEVELVEKGACLGVSATVEGKKEIVLNLEASKEEERKWNQAIMKLARVVK